jgi:peptide/nickel transport system substrate-binding protein
VELEQKRKHPKRPTIRAAAALLVLCLVAAACGGSGKQSERKQIPSTAFDLNLKPRDEVQDGGTLTLPIGQIPSNFNPLHASGTLGDNYDVVLDMLPSPFTTDEKQQFHVDKRYFESAELTATDPKQVVTYRLNPEAVWLDGTPITWKDLESQWKAVRGTDPDFEIASPQGDDKVESVVMGRDDREAVVTFAEKFADWQGLFSPLIPASTTSNPDAFNKGWIDKPITSAGPFRFDSIDRTAQTIILVRNEKWWGNKAKLDRIIFRVIDIDAQIDSLANGEIDQVDIGPDVNAYKRAQNLKGVDIRRAGGPSYRHITMNAESAVMSDIRVRRAIGLGINRDSIASALLGAVDVPPAPQNNLIYKRNQAGYQDNSGEFAKRDVDKAAGLLDEAGWKLEGDVREKDGQQLKLRFVIPANVTQAEQESGLIQQQLRQLGVLSDIQAVPQQDFFDKYIDVGTFDITIFTWGGTPFPISSSKSLFQKPRPGKDGQLMYFQNKGRIGTDEIDQKFDEATRIFDPKEAIRLGNEIDAKLWELVHTLPMYQRPQIIAVDENLANFGAAGFKSIPVEDVGYVKKK